MNKLIITDRKQKKLAYNPKKQALMTIKI